MSQQTRQAMLLGVMLVLLIGVAGYSTRWMLTQRQTAQAAADDYAASQAIAKRIEATRQSPTVAADEARGRQALGRHINTASQKAGLSQTSVPKNISPEPAQRVSDTPYMRKPTRFPLRRVSVRQLVAFLYHVTDGSGLRVHELRLAEPRGGSPGDRWDAAVTLTYLIYEPREGS